MKTRQMKRACLVAVLPILLQIAGCTPDPELDKANKKIAALEEQLAIERNRNLPAQTPPANSSTLATTLNSPAAVENEVETAGTQWSYSADDDKMTGGTTYHAVVTSTNTVNFDFPYSGEQHARLGLRVSPRHGKDVMFSIEQGQILCQSYQDCEILVRFDNEKPQTFSAVGAADNSSEIIFIRNYGRFVEKLKKSKLVRISVGIYQQGAPIFEFDVSGFRPHELQAKR